MSGTPMSGTPMSGTPMSDTPMSGTPSGTPVSGTPVLGTPISGCTATQHAQLAAQGLDPATVAMALRAGGSLVGLQPEDLVPLIVADWQTAIDSESSARPDIPLDKLHCLSAQALAAVQRVVPGSATPAPRPLEVHPSLRDVRLDPDADLPDTNQPPITDPRPPRPPDNSAELLCQWRAELGGRIPMEALYQQPEEGELHPAARIRDWLSKAIAHARHLVAAQESDFKPPASPPRRPPDLVIPIEHLLCERARPFVWDCRNPLDCFPVVHDDRPFHDDATLSINVAWLLQHAELIGFPDRELLSDLDTGMCFNNDTPIERTTILCANARLFARYAAQSEAQVDEYIEKGWAERHTDPEGEPLLALPFLPSRILPCSSVEKKRTSKRRMTTDPSRDTPSARGQAVNNSINTEALPKAPLPTTSLLAQIFATMLASGAAVWLVSLDLSSAYQMLRYKSAVLWACLNLFGGGITVQKRLGYGLASSPNQYQRLSNLLVAIVRYYFERLQRDDPLPSPSRHPAHGSMYLDDSAIAGASLALCLRMAMIFTAVFQRAGLPMSAKSAGPARQLDLLGLSFCTIAQALAAPTEKIAFLQRQIDQLLYDDGGNVRKYVNQSKLLSIAGSLIFLCPAVPRLRSHLNEAFRLANVETKHNNHVRASDLLRLDLLQARELVASHRAQPLSMASRRTVVNGLMPSHLPTTVNERAVRYSSWSSDASNDKIAIYSDGYWAVFLVTPDMLRYLSISHLEMIGVVAAILAFGHRFLGAAINGLCDNASCCMAVNTQKCRNVTMNLALSAALAASARFDIILALSHVRSLENGCSDHITRDASIRSHFDHKNHREPPAAVARIAALAGHALQEIPFPPEIFQLATTMCAVAKADFAASGGIEEVHGPPARSPRPGSDPEMSEAEIATASSARFLSRSFAHR